MTSATYRIRFRFRSQRKLQLPGTEHTFVVAGRDVILKSQEKGRPISTDNWLIMSVRGFATEQEAADFGRALKIATELSSTVARVGIDSGLDLPTLSFAQEMKDALRALDDVILRDNIHGLDIYVDDPRVTYKVLNIEASATHSPEPFLSGIDHVFDIAAVPSPRARKIVLLLNYALTRPDPVAQIVFAISAVEMLGQDNQNWSDDQKKLLKELARSAETSTIATSAESSEVADAIRRGTHKAGLRQGVLRLLASLNLTSLKPSWDKIYGERSTLVHGLAPMPGVDYTEQARRTLNICGRILFTALAREMPGADREIDTIYPLD